MNPVAIVAEHDSVADADTIIDLVLAVHSADRHDPDWAGDIESQAQRQMTFRLVDVAADSVIVYTPTSEQTVAAYSAMDPAGADPVVFVWEYGCPNPDIVLLDGAHRVRAAHARGDQTITAWVPEDYQPR